MPLREMVQNMQGLAALAEQRRQVKLQEEQMAKQKSGMEALNQYIETEKNGMPDMSLFYKAVTAVPDAAGNVLKGIGIDEKRKAQDASRFIMEAAPLVENRDAFVQKLKGRIDYLRANNRPAAESEALLEQYLAGDVAGVKNNLKGVAGALVGTGSLDPKAYEYAFGPPEEKMNEYQKASIDIKNKELALDSQRIAAASTQKPGDIERNWAIYQELLKTDPAAAAKFGNAARFEPQSGDVGLQQSLADAKASGKIVAEAKANLPKVESAAKYVKGYVESVLNHEGRPWSTGLMSLAPTVRGTRQADFRKRMEQINGASFLSAFESLRGGGQITQIEGEKATTAINRMSAATNDDEFNAAAKDFLDVVDSGVKNAKDLASGKTMQPIKPDQPPAQGGSKYKIEVVQ